MTTQQAPAAPASSTPDEILADHRNAGHLFEAGGVQSFVLDSGAGEPVVCLHGVPSSSFLYRKLVAALAARGMRGVAFDFPGMGLAARPTEFDYSWSGPSAWTGEAIDALGIEKCHLVVHDIGGPIGIEWAAAHPDRVLSLTILNSPIRVGTFHRPWPMHPFSIRGVGEIWLRLMRPPFWSVLFRSVGLARQSAMTNAEINAYLTLLKRVDGGRMFLRIMRGFELTAQKEEQLVAGLRARTAPATIIWGQDDTMLGADRLAQAREAVQPEALHLVPGKHFLQEDGAEIIADLIAAASRAGVSDTDR